MTVTSASPQCLFSFFDCLSCCRQVKTATGERKLVWFAKYIIVKACLRSCCVSSVVRSFRNWFYFNIIWFITTYKHYLTIYSAFSCIYYSLFIDFSPSMFFSRWLNCFYNATPLIVFTPLHTYIKCTGQIMYFHLAPLFIHLCC